MGVTVTQAAGAPARPARRLAGAVLAPPRRSGACRAAFGWLMTLVLLIPDGVGVRNFVLGPFLREASRRQHVDVLHGIPDPIMQRLSPALPDRWVEWHPLRSPEGRRVEDFLRNALGYAHMAWARTGLMNLWLLQPIPATTWRRWALTATARMVGRAAAFPGGIRILDRAHRWAARRGVAVEHYRHLLRRLKPSVLFCTHQRPPQIVAPVMAARSLGIPTATFIFSWDNLSSKARIAAPFDHFLVWSELMKDELLRYYPDVSADRVHVVGTPQFEPYADRRLIWPREEFFRHIGGDSSRPLICYTGADPGTCPGDPIYVRTLLDLIRTGAIEGRPQVLLRPTPVDVGTRYDQVRADYPELLYARPAWVHPEHGGTWANVMPLPEDVQFLANLTHHSDMNINWASTVTLDFALHDKPVINVAFDVLTPPPRGVPAWELYELSEHYRPVISLGAVRLARSGPELATHVNAYLADPGRDRVARRQLSELEIGYPMGGSSGRIIEVLEEISR